MATTVRDTIPSLCFLATIFVSHAGLDAQYDPKAAEPIPRLRGTFVIGGGGTLPGVVYDAFLTMTGGESTDVVILSAAKIDDADETPFLTRKVASIHSLIVSERNPDKTFAALDKTRAVWIVGGSATEFAARFQGTKVEAQLRRVIARGGVIGGNGAVTRALTRVMIQSGEKSAEVGTGLELIPGAVIDDHYTAKKRRHRILSVLATKPDLVGLGVDEGTAMVLHHRFLDVLGEGSVYGCVGPSPKRGLRVDRMNRRESPASQKRATRGGRRRARNRAATGVFRPRRLGDLIALSRSAQARVAKTFPAWSPKPPRVEKGALIIVGGGGMPSGLMDRFIELAGGKEAARLVYIPCTEAEKVDREPRAVAAWRRAGVKHATWIHTKDRETANTDKELLDKLRRATGIFFGGGRQWNLVDSWQHTTAHELMHGVLARGGVIAGSSAGASIQASYMVRGNSLGNLDPMAEGYETGLGFLTGVAIDQHFSQRGRLPDMTALINNYPELLGIGLDEASAIVVQGSIATAFSRRGRRVHIYDRTKPVQQGQPDYLRLEHGAKYDLKNRRMVDAPAGKNAPASTRRDARVRR